VRLRWRLPADADRVRVLVVRRLDRFPRGPRDGVRVLDRPATWLADHPLSPRRVFYLLYAVDRAGNRSRPVRGSVRRFWPPLLGPIDDARVGRRPLLRWRRAPRAAYYNVQVWRGTAARKVVTTWPVRTSYRVPSRLRPGRYTWYVYPGFGERRAARYGRLLGSATFVVR
jgi:hypothetical protein